MGKILIEDMEFFSFHGHYQEEQIVGNRFLVTLEMVYDSIAAAKSDELEDALNYQTAYEIVKKEMGTPAKLLEHLCQRILNALDDHFGNQLIKTKIIVSKMNPSMGGKIDRVSVEMDSKSD